MKKQLKINKQKRGRVVFAAGLLSVVAVAGGAFFLFSSSSLPPPSDIPGRWYSKSQVAAGAKLFAENCVSCHGVAGRGAKNWRQRQADGSYPPPPLNGTGHAWHHSLDALRRTIERGSIAQGGKMPAFAEKLSEEERDAVIAYLQSRWQDKIYRVWAEKVQQGGKH